MKFTIYDIETGRIIKHFMGSQSQLENNVPAGCSAILGAHDPNCERLDHETGQSLDWQPPKPSPRHEWSETKKRWVLSAKARQRHDLLEEVAWLERAQQRPLRELAINPDSEEARQRLAEIEAQIEIHRKTIRQAT